MLRLFSIKDTKTNKVVVGSFSNKKDAKEARNNMNEEVKSSRYVVTLGVDHWRYVETKKSQHIKKIKSKGDNEMTTQDATTGEKENTSN